MSNEPQRPGRRAGEAAPIRLELDREQTGTLLGSLAWVMGALQIMRDRGHAEQDEEFHELHDTLSPRLERLVQQLTDAREAAAADPTLEEALERAYTDVREAFEAWIQLTAVDTLSAAVGQRLASTLDEQDADEEQ